MVLRDAAGPCVLTLALAALALPAGAAEPVAPRQRVLRTWHDTIKVDGGEIARRVEVVFDYTAGVAYENAYDTTGKRIGSVEIVHEPPQPSAEEIAEAVGIMKADPMIGRILRRTQALTHGGFVLQEPEGAACGPRTRCLQILVVSPDARGLLRRVVVDLTKRAITYRAYIPSETEAGK